MSMLPTLKLQEHPNQASGCQKSSKPMDKGEKVQLSSCDYFKILQHNLGPPFHWPFPKVHIQPDAPTWKPHITVLLISRTTYYKAKKKSHLEFEMTQGDQFNQNSDKNKSRTEFG